MTVIRCHRDILALIAWNYDSIAMQALQPLPIAARYDRKKRAVRLGRCSKARKRWKSFLKVLPTDLFNNHKIELSVSRGSSQKIPSPMHAKTPKRWGCIVDLFLQCSKNGANNGQTYLYLRLLFGAIYACNRNSTIATFNVTRTPWVRWCVFVRRSNRSSGQV